MSDIKEISIGSTVYDVKVKNDHALKSYLDDGTLLTDTEGLSDVTSYAHSTFDSSKFTVVGSPTITDDGIASGFTTSSYITANIGAISTGILKIKERLSISSTTVSGNSCLMGIFGGNNNRVVLDRVSPQYGGKLEFLVYVDGTNKGAKSFSTLFDGQDIDVEIIVDYTNTITTVNIYQNNSLVESKSNAFVPNLDSTTKAYIGGRFLSTDTNLKADLKQFSITVDGVPTFSGNKTGTDTYTINGSTVSVPYILSKTGSKIVDSYYRTQVTSVYNAFGYAPYYTLNEGTNFTLPMGEVYGIIGKNDIIEYANGTSGYRIWVKTGYCEQWGQAQDSAVVSLLKTYANTNYCILLTTKVGTGEVRASSVREDLKTTSSFVPYYSDSNYYGYWKTSGYLAEGQW